MYITLVPMFKIITDPSDQEGEIQLGKSAKEKKEKLLADHAK